MALIAPCLGTSDSRLTLAYTASAIPHEELSEATFETTLRSILFTATDSKIVNGHLTVPFGSVGLTLPTNWSSTPVFQVYNLESKALVQQVTLGDYADFLAATASSNYFILSRANGLSRAYTAEPTTPVYGYIDIFKWNTSSAYKQSDVLHSIRIGQHDAARPFYESPLQSLLAVGVSDDEKYVFYNYESGDATNAVAPKYARIGIIDLASGSIAAEIDIPESAHPAYEFAIAPHGAKFVQHKNGVYTFIFSYYSTSLVAALPATTQARILVGKFDSKSGSLTITASENLPGEANSFDISKNGKYLTVGTPYTGAGQLFTTPTPSTTAVEPTANLRVYRFHADDGSLTFESASSFEADIAHVEYSPNGDRLAVTSTLSFGVAGIDASATLSLFKVKSSGSAFDLLDSKQIAPLGSTASWADDKSIWTIGMPNKRFKNVAQWTVV